jgi:colicin V production protein
MGPASEIQGSPGWQNIFLLFSVLWILISILRGWTNGLMRQVAAIVALIAAAFFVLHFTSSLAEYLRREVPGVFQIPVAALVIWIISYNGILLIGRILFKRTRDQSSLPVKMIYGAGGALIGFAYGLLFIWSLLIGVRVAGRIAEDQIEIQQTDREPPGTFVLSLAKLKNSLELGAGRSVINVVDPTPPAFYRELDKFSRLIGNPRAIRKMLDYPGFHNLLQDPKIVELERDPELLADIQSGNVLAVFSNPKVVALTNDPHLRQVFSLGELKAALDYAGNTTNEDQNSEFKNSRSPESKNGAM